MKKRLYAFLFIIAMIAGLALPLGRTKVSAAGPTILAHPEDTEKAVNETATFSVSVAETDVTYSWQSSKDGGLNWNNSSFPGHNTSTLSVVANSARDGYMFRCQVTDNQSTTVTSNAAKLTVTANLSITTQPSDISAKIGETAQFSLTATGVGLKYQWQASKDGGTSWNNSGFTGNNTYKLLVPVTAARNGYKFRCKITDKNGTSLISNPATLTLTIDAVKITSHPSNSSTTIGFNATFKVVASGTGLKYRWQTSKDNGKSWTNSSLKGYNTDTLTVQASYERNGYLFRCIVTDINGSTATSNNAKLTVVSDLMITGQPQDVSSGLNKSVSFHVEVNGTGLKYQWQTSKDGGKIWTNSSLSGYNTATLTLKVTLDRNNYMFRCLITDKYNTKVTSDAATLKIRSEMFMFIQSPLDYEYVDVGTEVKFICKTNGIGVKYLWQTSKDNGETWVNSGLTGYNTDTLTVKASFDRDGYLFRCIATEIGGQSLTSRPAKLTVKAKGAPVIKGINFDDTGTICFMKWTEIENATYTVLYAEGNGTLKKYADKIVEPYALIKDLKPKTNYRFAVFATVNGVAGPLSPIYSTSTPG